MPDYFDNRVEPDVVCLKTVKFQFIVELKGERD